MPRHNVTKRLPALLLLPAWLLTACATSSTPTAVACPQIPPAPAIREPLPSPSYSETAQQVIDGWRKKLTDTPQMPVR